MDALGIRQGADAELFLSPRPAELDPEPAGELEARYTFTRSHAGGLVQLIVSPPPAAGAVTLWVDWPSQGMFRQSLRRQLV